MKNRRLLILLFLLLGSLGLVSPPTVEAQTANPAPTILVLTISGPLTPVMREYLRRGIRLADERDAELLIFRLNTPGGSVTLMDNIVADILASDVPVVVFVYPSGGMAASAGTIITLAGHASAMSPDTIIGAASPVSSTGQNLDTTSEAKLKNAMRATVRNLTARRPPEATTIAEQAIENATAVTAQEALNAGLVDFIATDVNDLLRQLDGFPIILKDRPVTLQTAYANVEEVPTNLLEQALQMLTDPNIVFVLLNLGVLALIVEISSPGGWIAGFTGVVCLALAGYGLGVLPVNWFGLVFVVTAFVLFLLDVKAPTHGALTAAGVGALIVGALVLFNSNSTPTSTHVSVPLVIGMSIGTALIFFSIITLALRAQSVPLRTGLETITGQLGVVRVEIEPRGSVQVGSELWSAQLDEGEEAMPVGTKIRVVRVEGLHLIVRRA